MRSKTLGTLALAAAVTTGCGGGSHFVDHQRAPAPVNLTVYINDHRVSVSPSKVGAGPVVFIITNQASNAESLSVIASGGAGSQPLADTGPISPQGTAQLQVNLSQPGAYTVGIAPSSTSEAAAATPTGIQSAFVNVGAPRPSSNNNLLQP
jgi:hypothetical protein